MQADMNAVNNDSTLSKDQKRGKIDRLQEDSDVDLALLKANQEKARKVLNDGMENTREQVSIYMCV